ncbi:MAG: DNA/RNA nuclease SfsA [Asgard group archaeon]|nr:DNA/RNA nuclease SfsA [Asgard group archaeon]
MVHKEIAIEGTVKYATFKNRPNRFLVNLIPDGRSNSEKAFLHDPGRMKELLTDNVRLLIRKPLNPENRKTKWDILAVEHKGRLVTINSSLPNRVAKTALMNYWIQELAEFDYVKSEISYGKSRLDFLLEKNKLKCYVEVKGVTLVKNKIALFPDAPTSRGVRHVNELIEIVAMGYKGVILFICMRDDPIGFAPNNETDPTFSKTLQTADKEGVEILVYKVKPIIKNQQLILQFKDKIKVNK